MWTFVWISSFVRDFLKNTFRCPEVLRQLFHVPLRWELIDGVTTCEAVDFGLSFSFYIDLINSKQECGSSHRDFALPLSERMCDWGTSSTVRAQLLEDSCCMSERISLTRQGNTFFLHICWISSILLHWFSLAAKSNFECLQQRSLHLQGVLIISAQ